MYQGRKYAAFVAVMSVLCILFGGCGGGGGGTKPPEMRMITVGPFIKDSTVQPSLKVNWLDGVESGNGQTDASGMMKIGVTKQGAFDLALSFPDQPTYKSAIVTIPAGEVNGRRVEITTTVVVTRSLEVETSAIWNPRDPKVKIQIIESLPTKSRQVIVPDLIGEPTCVSAEGDPINDGKAGMKFFGILENSMVFNVFRPGRTLITVVLKKDPEHPISGVVEIRDESDPVKMELVPASSVIVSGVVRLSATFRDDDQVAFSVLLIDNTEVARAEGTVVSIQWNSQDLKLEGHHTFQAKAKDRWGNEGTSPTVTMTVDNVPDPVEDPFVTMDTTPSRLVMVDEVDEPARYIGDYWKYDGTIKFENISVDEKNQILVYAGSVVAYPRDGDPYVWAPTAWNNGRSTYSPQGYWYATGLSGEFWRFNPRNSKLDHETLDRPGTSWMCKADNTGPLWVYWGNGHFTCLSADLKTVLKDLDTDATDVQGFAADWGKDTLVYARLSPDHTATEIVRRRISTVEVQVLESYPNIGIGGIEFDPTHGQVLVNGALDKGYLIQLGKKDGQWGELYRTPLSIPADQLVRGATFGKYYTSHSDWKVRGWQYRPL